MCDINYTKNRQSYSQSDIDDLLDEARREARSELLADLRQRCVRAEAETVRLMSEMHANSFASRRLDGKRQAFAVVRDWLRSYEDGEIPEAGEAASEAGEGTT